MTKLFLIKTLSLNLNRSHKVATNSEVATFLKDGLGIKMSNKKIKDRVKDKNLQDDWLPDATRRTGATSDDLPEYGGDLKEVETIEKEVKQLKKRK